MDYTTLARVKQEMHIVSGSSVDDALLGTLITAASRALDRFCTGTVEGDNYFQLESVTDEETGGQIDYRGMILCYPHKPLIHSVEAFAFTDRPFNPVTTVPVSPVARCYARGPRVEAWPDNITIEIPSQVYVTISYTGGLSGSTAGLPEDLQELAAILCARFYREAEGGLSDAIGVPELAQVMYTKAWPIRVKEQINTFKRRVGWRFVS